MINNAKATIYVPTITNGANVAASANVKSFYVQIDKFVTVHCSITIDATTAALPTNFAISLPIASNLGVYSDLVGGVFVQTPTVVYPSGYVRGDAANDRADCSYFSETATPPNREVYVTFSYEILP